MIYKYLKPKWTLFLISKPKNQTPIQQNPPKPTSTSWPIHLHSPLPLNLNPPFYLLRSNSQPTKIKIKPHHPPHLPTPTPSLQPTPTPSFIPTSSTLQHSTPIHLSTIRLQILFPCQKEAAKLLVILFPAKMNKGSRSSFNQ